MRETTQTHIRNQGVAIAEVRGALQALAEPTAWASKQYLQQRIAIMEEKLANIQHSLTEIEHSESLEWMEDKAGIDA
jgi:DNA-binding transcriptional MerR regulator